MVTSRREKLVALQNLYHLESGSRIKNSFADIDELFLKAACKKALDRRIISCRRCTGLNRINQTEAAVGYGNLNSNIFLVGQSLCTVCMNTGIPFTRGSGYLLDASLKLAGLKRWEVFISNLVHCHPPKNRKSEDSEIENCIGYLAQEIEIVKPKILIMLGADVKKSMTNLYEDEKPPFRMHGVKHPAYFLHAGFGGAIDWIVNLATVMEKYK